MKISFEAELWLWRAENGVGWHFITLTEAARDAVKAETEGIPRKGFGSVKVRGTIEKTSWETSIFPAKDVNSYLLPVKASVRNANRLEAGDRVKVTIELV